MTIPRARYEQARGNSYPLLVFGIAALVGGVLGLVLDDDLSAQARYMPMWMVYGLLVLSGILLSGLALQAEMRQRRDAHKAGGAS